MALQLPASAPTILRRSRGHLLRGSVCRRKPSAVCHAAEEETDLVTRLVGKVFGQAALDDRNPFGVKRMDWSTVKDLEVVTDREAAPRSTDDPYMALLRPLLAGTSLEEEDLRLAYSANEDGWTGADFIGRVAGFGACIILARSEGGAVFGGYNPLGFDGYGADKASMGCFLFTWPDGDTRASKPFKLAKVGTDQLSVIDRPDQGPQCVPTLEHEYEYGAKFEAEVVFGPGDLKILLARGSKTKATSKLVDYARPAGARSLFSKEEGGRAELVELRAYVRKGGKLKFELDGVRWKSSYAKDGSGEGAPPGIFSM